MFDEKGVKNHVIVETIAILYDESVIIGHDFSYWTQRINDFQTVMKASSFPPHTTYYPSVQYWCNQFLGSVIFFFSVNLQKVVY